MNDRVLLELAANAAGYTITDWCAGRRGADWAELSDTSKWNPIEDDGDALRLAVSLGIHVEQNTAFKRACAMWYGKSVLREELFVSWGDDKYAATRRAIVRAAAEIGRQMQEGGAA